MKIDVVIMKGKVEMTRVSEHVGERDIMMNGCSKMCIDCVI